ncbi:MAG: hypothetical protein AAF502_25360 [Bacteroidota bacterium]
MISEKFQLELQTALTELQSNLESLENAKSQIEGAKGAAIRVVSGMDELRENYGGHLQALNSKVDGFLEEAEKQFRENVEDSTQQFKKVAEEIRQLHESATHSSENQVSSVLREMDELKSSYGGHLSSMTSHVASFMDNSDKQFKSIVEKGSSEIKEAANEVLSLHDKKTQEFKGLLDQALSQIKELNANYALHLDNLDGRQKTMLNLAEQKIVDFLNQNASKVDEHLKFSNESMASTQNAILDFQNQQTEIQEKAADNLRNQQTKHLESITTFQEEKILELVNGTNASVEKALTQMLEHQNQVNDIFSRQNEEVKMYLDRFSELLETVRDLEIRISQVEFPELFEELGNKVNRTYNNTRSLKERLEEVQQAIQSDLNQKTTEISKLYTNQNKQLQQLKWLLVISGGIILVLIILLFK